MAASLVAIPTGVSADHISSQQQEAIKRDSDTLSRYGGPWYRGGGGGTGSNGFYYAYDSDSYSRWDFGELRGIFRASLFYPGQDAVKYGSCGIIKVNCKPRPPTASPRIKILQINDQGRTEVLYDWASSIRDRGGNRKQGWWGWNNVELNGHIIVEISKRYSDNRYRLAADSFQFVHREYLQEDIDFAISKCKSDVLDAVLTRAKIENYGRIVITIADAALTSAVLGAATAIFPPGAVVAQTANWARISVNGAQLARAVDKLYDLYIFFDNIGTLIEVTQELHDAISEALPDDLSRQYDLYLVGCNRPHGINWWDDLWSIFVPDGYVDYMSDDEHYEDVTRELPTPRPTAAPTPRPTAAPTPRPTAAPTVRLSQGNSVRTSTCTSSLCHYMKVELINFGPGPYRVYCAHRGVPSRGWPGGTWVNYQTSHTVSQYCVWGFLDPVYVFVRDTRTGETVYSNNARW